MKARLSSILLLLMVIVITAGCSNNRRQPEAPISDVQYRYISIEEAVSVSSLAFWGQYTGAVRNFDYWLFSFQIKELIYGDYDEENIDIYAISERGMSEDMFDPDETYLLLIEEFPAAVQGDPPRYLFTFQERVLPEEGPYVISGETIDLPENVTISKYVKDIKDSLPDSSQTDPDDVEYTDEVEEMFYRSSFIGIVTVKEQLMEGSGTTDTYLCGVDELYKGDQLYTKEDGTIYMAFIKGMVQPGNSYLVGFNAADEKSVIYSQATRNSVYAPDDQEVIECIHNYMKVQTES